MSDAPLWHRLYTHAGSIGGHFVNVERDASRVLSPEAAADLDDLMKKTRGGFVVRRYAGFACVIASREAADAGGRRGVRNHARVAKSDDATFDVAALMELTPSEEMEASVTIRPYDFPPRDGLRELLLAWIATHGKKARVRVQIDRLDPHTAAIAWSALPIGLQRGGSWAVDTDDGCPVDVVLSASGGRRPADVASPQLAELVARYVELLLDGSSGFRAILRNPAINSAGRLADALRTGEGWR
ncbi:MAG TPA: hypothetical protein VGF48_01910 [Thermoanaerobaculia bacterium]|jgi:hypothetical protein